MGAKVSYTDDDRIDVPICEYNELVRASEKIAAVERLVAACGYVSVTDIVALLDIKKAGEKNAE